MKKVIKIVVIILILYLSISSAYVLFHIDWKSNESQIVGMGFSVATNRLRLFMGLPKTYTTYEGVSPIFLIEVIIKIILVGILIRYLRRK